ncbi:hypothetical protein PTTG_03443 [Puccinia triticina 1-1 BBBD Race 1]|uniref:Retrotransposon gag domain-containing protein n=1 Tax=Puccinia triticina (isolate 1-1 / race 1 (BBBD)) TaxID=630390 RepID=A0A180GTT7_PUCT1|nr:hypothetical protein PTTG_03443 [Puccinia triticina 1-1 BBBD Race 1]
MEMQRMTLQMQQANLDARQAADRNRLRRLEEAVTHALTNTPTGNPSPIAPPCDGRIDLQRFRTSDGPTFTGPFQDIEVFLTWIYGLEVFFETKAVTLDSDKIRIAGTLIKEANLLSFYSNQAASYLSRSWVAFKSALFPAALPLRWRREIKSQIRGLRMAENKTFVQFESWGRTLQRMVNFGVDPPVMTDEELADWIVQGLPANLRGQVHMFKLLEADPFDYDHFARRTRTIYDAMPRRTTTAAHLANTDTPGTTESRYNGVSREEYLWRIHAYLDSVGLFHFCKRHCGTAPGNCPGPMDRARVNVPTNFKPPPKPTAYTRPKAWSGPQGPAQGARTNTGPERPTGGPAGVAGVAEEDGWEEDDDDLL